MHSFFDRCQKKSRPKPQPRTPWQGAQFENDGQLRDSLVQTIMIGVASSDFSESFKGSQLQCYKFGPQGLQGLQQPPNASSAVETTERMHQAEASHLRWMPRSMRRMKEHPNGWMQPSTVTRRLLFTRALIIAEVSTHRERCQ